MSNGVTNPLGVAERSTDAAGGSSSLGTDVVVRQARRVVTSWYSDRSASVAGDESRSERHQATTSPDHSPRRLAGYTLGGLASGNGVRCHDVTTDRCLVNGITADIERPYVQQQVWHAHCRPIADRLR